MVMVAHSWMRTIWTIDYQWRRAVYLKKCENKARPQLKCDGKCYLLKRLNGNDTSEESAPVVPEALRQLKDIALFAEDASGWMLVFSLSKERLLYPPYLLPPMRQGGRSVFQPPETSNGQA